MPKPQNEVNVELQETDRLPTADVVDEVIWARLSRFWTNAYNPENKEALTALYSAYIEALNAEYIRLFEIDRSKSIVSCPVLSQRRWLKLNLGKYSALKAYLRGLLAGAADTINTGFTCTIAATTHVKHWHVTLPLSVFVNSGFTLPFPTNTGLIEIYRNNKRLLPKTAGAAVWDYDVSEDGKKLIFVDLAPQFITEYTAVVGFDFSGTEYDGLKPVVYKVNHLTGREYEVPAAFSNGLPFVYGVVSNQLDTYNINNVYFTAYTSIGVSDETGDARHAGRAGVILLPEAYDSNSSVYVFGLVAGEWNVQHRHLHTSLQFTTPTVTTFSPDTQLQPSLFDTIDKLTSPVLVFVDGELQSPTTYFYDFGTNTFTLKTPVRKAFGEVTRVDILSTEETVLDGPAKYTHVHTSCADGDGISTTAFATFDDGGEFDDEDVDGAANFDDFAPVYTIELETPNVETQDLEVYIDGELKQPYVDYAVAPGVNSTFITFVESVTGKSVIIDYRIQKYVYVYGLSDIKPFNAVFNISPSVVTSNVDNIVAYTKSYEETYGGLSDEDRKAFMGAARVMAAGGNPLLYLFEDEFVPGINAAADTLLTAEETRNLESLNTTLEHIPVITDHTYLPTFRYFEGDDFKVTDGELHSSVNFTSSVWCPLVLLDERELENKFGVLLGYKGASTPAYKNMLTADLNLRYNGATLENLQGIGAIAAGSPTFKYSGVVLDVLDYPVYKVLTVKGANNRYAHFKLPVDAQTVASGSSVLTGQSLVFPAVFSGGITNTFFNYYRGTLIVNARLGNPVPGDSLRIKLFTESGKAVYINTTIKTVAVTTVLSGLQTTLGIKVPATLRATVDSTLLIYRDGGPPYAGFDGIVNNIQTVSGTKILTTAEEVILDPGVVSQFNVGDEVLSGQAVRPELCTVNDGREDWWKVQPSDTVTTFTKAGAYSYNTVVLDDTDDPQPVRGDTLNGRYVVTGVMPNGVYTIAPLNVVGLDARGDEQLVFTHKEKHEFVTYIRFPVSTTLSTGITGDAVELPVVDTTDMPDNGVAYLDNYTIEYHGTTPTTLQNCVWNPSSNNAEFIAGTSLTVVKALYDYVVHPALNTAALKRTNPPATVDYDTAEEVFNLIGHNTAVLNMKTLGVSTALETVLADATPATSLVLIHTENEQAYDASVSGETLIHSYPRIEIAIEDIDIDGTAHRITFTVTDPDSTVHTFDYELIVVNGSGNEFLTTNGTHSTVVRNLVVGASYTLKYKITNDKGNYVSSSYALEW